MIFTKEKLLRIINEEIESVKEVEFMGDPMYHQGQEFKTGLGSGNTLSDMSSAPTTFAEQVSDMIMAELERQVAELAGVPADSPDLAGIDDDLLAIAMRIRDKLMTDLEDAKEQIVKLSGMMQ